MAMIVITVMVCDRCGFRQDMSEYMLNKSGTFGKMELKWKGELGIIGPEIDKVAITPLNGEAWICEKCTNDFKNFMAVKP